MRHEKYTIETEDSGHHILRAHGQFVRYFPTLAEAQEYAEQKRAPGIRFTDGDTDGLDTANY